MTKLVRAILINPFARTVTEIQHDVSDFRQIYEALSVPEHKVDTFTCVYLPDGDAIYVDDDGLLKGKSQFFQWAGYRQPLSGCGLILGSDKQGESVACKISLEAARAAVTFVGERDGDAILAAFPTRFIPL